MKVLIGNSISKGLRTGLTKSFPKKQQVRASIGRFPSTEAFAEILDDVRGEAITIIQSIAATKNQTANDYAVQLLLLIDTLKEYGAGPIWVIEPFAGYGRQDKTRKGHHDSIACKSHARQLKNAGAVGFSTIEMHSERGLNFHREQFGDANVFNLDPTALLLKTLDIQDPSHVSVGGPDGSSDPRALKISKATGASMFHTEKHRDVLETEITHFDGDVAGQTADILDDMIDRGSTTFDCGEYLDARKAKAIEAASTHMIGSENSLEKLLTRRRADGRKRLFSRLIFSDTIDQEEEINRLNFQYPGAARRIKIFTTADLLAQHIKNDITNHPSMRPEPR